jgi:two-component system chemotaxis sensor kinase CheA
VLVIDGREAVKWRRSNKVETLQLCDVGRMFGMAKPPELEPPDAGNFDAPPAHADLGLQRPPMRNEPQRNEHTSMSFPYRPARGAPTPPPKRVGRRKKRGYVVVISLGSTTESKRLGLIVDGLVGQQNVVIKGLGPSLKNVAGFTGATQLADQRIALVLDAPSIIEEVLSHKGLVHGGPHGF